METSFWKAFKVAFLIAFNYFMRKKAGDVLVKVGEIYENMKCVLEETHVERIMVMKAENNGGMVRPGCQIYATLVYEDYKAPLESVKEKYVRLAVDSLYMNTLASLYTEKKIYLDTERMKDGLIRAFYKDEKVKFSEMHYLAQDKKAFYYLVMVTTKESEKFDGDHHQAVVTVAVSNIRNIFRTIK